MNIGELFSLLRKHKAVVLTMIAAPAVACIRVYYCLELPANTGDVLRHAVYGLLVNQYGWHMADLPLAEIGEDLTYICWSNKPFNYPALTLAFDSLVTWVSPTIFSMKLALTLLEALSAVLIYMHTKEKLLALIYWASPISIWWVSHEGQFEPLQNLFIIIAIYLLPRRRGPAWICLALAIQVKLFAVFLLPLFLFSEKNLGALTKHVGLFAIGFIPTVAASFFYSPISNLVHSASLFYNPYYWNLFNSRVFGWIPPWLMAFNQISSYGVLILLVTLLFRVKKKTSYMGPIGFIAFVKLLTNAQSWYMATTTAFFLSIENTRLRFWLFFFAPMLDIRALLQIIFIPFGHLVGDYFDHITPLTVLMYSIP
ncbi:MAG: hypothetical protein GY847_04450 [Proteobacteria bacterium]|nr:hypothetical protein [Pseudomonadota bacterium]